MRFYVDALNVDLYTPVKFNDYDVKVSTLISLNDINDLIQCETGFDKIVYPFEKFKSQDLSVPQEWIRFVASRTSTTVSSIKNAGSVRNDLIQQYGIEMNKKVLPDVLYRIRQCLIIQCRQSFKQGDLLYFTTTITYPKSLSRIYLMECIII